MAAILRHEAARRLGGSMIQPARAPFTEERRRLGSRLLHTEEHPHEVILREVQQKKEELFDMISNAEKSYSTSTWANMRLHQHLSVEITPRPHESCWCHVQSGRWFSGALKKAGFVSLPFMVASCLEYCRDYIDNKKVAGHDDGRRE